MAKKKKGHKGKKKHRQATYVGIASVRILSWSDGSVITSPKASATIFANMPLGGVLAGGLMDINDPKANVQGTFKNVPGGRLWTVSFTPVAKSNSYICQVTLSDATFNAPLAMDEVSVSS